MRRLLPLTFILVIIACKKEDVRHILSITPTASINIVNVVVNGQIVKLNKISNDSVLNYNYKQFGLLSGENNIYVYPVADSVHPYYNNVILAGDRDIYSLFISGSILNKVDTLLLKDNIPTYSDSSCGIRFINLVYNSNPIIVTQAATPTVIDYSSLSYRQVSNFKKYPALSVNSSYTFQVRDALSNSVLATYTLTSPRFFNCTLVWKGQISGTGNNAPSILRVNNY